MSGTALGLLVEASLRAALVASLVAAALAALRVQAGATRHAAWTIVLVAMLLMPALSRLVPAVGVPVPPAARDIVAAAAVATPVTPVPRAERAPGPPASALMAPPRREGSSSGELARPYGRVGSFAGAELLRRKLLGPVGSSPDEWSWAATALAVYVAGMVPMLLRLVLGLWGSRRLVSGARPIDGSARRRLGALAVPVRESDRIAVPVTVGTLPVDRRAAARLGAVARPQAPRGARARARARRETRSPRRRARLAEPLPVLVPSPRLVAAAHARPDRGAGVRRGGRALGGRTAGVHRRAAVDGRRRPRTRRPLLVGGCRHAWKPVADSANRAHPTSRAPARRVAVPQGRPRRVLRPHRSRRRGVSPGRRRDAGSAGGHPTANRHRHPPPAGLSNGSSSSFRTPRSRSRRRTGPARRSSCSSAGRKTRRDRGRLDWAGSTPPALSATGCGSPKAARSWR